MLIVGILSLFLGQLDGCFTHKMDRAVGRFIIDTFTSLHPSSTFTAFLCADQDNIVEFSRQISNNHILHEIKTSFMDYHFHHTGSVLAHQNFYILDLNCQGAEELLSKVNSNGLFIAPTKWLILEDSRALPTLTQLNGSQVIENDEPKLIRILKNFSLFPDSELIIGQRLKDTLIKLLSVYRSHLLRNLIIENRGTWSDVNSLEIYNYDVSSRRRKNLQQIPLKACAVLTHSNSIHHLEDFKEKSHDVTAKVTYILSTLLVAHINANVTFIFTSTSSYQGKNGSWSGLIGYLDRGDVDFGATSTFIVPENIGVIQYLQLYTPSNVRFIFRRPPLSHLHNLFTLPFDSSVWITSAISCIFGFSTLYITMKWEWRQVKDVPREDKIPGELDANPTISDSILVLVGAVTQQGSFFEPRTVSARMVILMLLIFYLSLFTAYAANIVALLQSSSGAVKNVKDLMNSPLKIGLHNTDYNRQHFGTFEDAVGKELYERRIKNEKNVWMTLEIGVKTLRNELFAFHADTSYTYNIIQSTYEEDEKCGFEEIDYLCTPDPLLTIRRQSPYLEIFKVGALWLEETGLRQRHTNIMYVKKPICTGQQKFVNVGTTECYAAYLTIGYGMSLTMILLIFEIIWCKSFDIIDVDSTDVKWKNEASNKNSSIVEYNEEV